MTYSLLIQNRQSGQIWDVASITEKATFTTKRTGSPGTLQFTLVDSNSVSFFEGDPVQLAVDGTPIFYGFVFSRSVDRWGVMEVTAYDQLRYLKANASYAFYGATAGDIIKQIGEDFQLSVGSLAATGYALPSYIQEDKTCLDIINGAVQQTLLNTGIIYVFWDNVGQLTLTPANEMISTAVVGNGSLLTDYTYKVDIDSQTYNQIKLVRPNEETGMADAYVVNDSNTIGQWGLLQYYAQVDEAMNEAQILAQAQAMLAFYDVPYETFSAEALGVVGLRAGQMLYLNIPERNLSQFVLLEQVTHTFEQNNHTMSIETLSLTKEAQTV